jgi:hypothetical protein
MATLTKLEYMDAFKRYLAANGIPVTPDNPTTVEGDGTITMDYMRPTYFHFEGPGWKFDYCIDYSMNKPESSNTNQAEVQHLRLLYGMPDTGVIAWKDFLNPPPPPPPSVPMLGLRVPQNVVDANAFGLDTKREYFYDNSNSAPYAQTESGSERYMLMPLGPFSRWWMKL